MRLTKKGFDLEKFHTCDRCKTEFVFDPTDLEEEKLYDLTTAMTVVCPGCKKRIRVEASDLWMEMREDMLAAMDMIIGR